MDPADLKLIMEEFEIEDAEARLALQENKGDVVAAMNYLISK